MPTNEQLTSWQGENWEHLSEVWHGLIANESQNPEFQGKRITSQEAGYVFQTLVVEAFRVSRARIEPPYSVRINPGTDDRTEHQLDGLLTRWGQGFLIESKFQRVDFDPIVRLHFLAESRPVGTMGLLFAAHGFTEPALNAAHILRPIRVLLFDGDDIQHALLNRSFLTAVRVKLGSAVKFGRANLPIAAFWQEEPAI